MAANETSPAGKLLPDVVICHMVVLAGTEAYGIDFDQLTAAGSKPVSKNRQERCRRMVLYGFTKPLPAPEPAIGFLRGRLCFPCKPAERHLFYIHDVCLRSNFIRKPVVAGIYCICMPALQRLLTKLKSLVMLRTDPFLCTLTDSAVQQIIIRIRGTPAPVHGSLDPPDLRGMVFCIGAEYRQFTGIVSHNGCRGSSDIQSGTPMANRMLDRRFSFQDQL